MVILRSKCIPVWPSSSPGKGRKSHLTFPPVTAASGSHSPSCCKFFPLLELMCLLSGITTEMPGCQHTAFHLASPYLYESDKTNPENRLESPYGLACKKQAKNVS